MGFDDMKTGEMELVEKRWFKRDKWGELEQ